MTTDEAIHKLIELQGTGDYETAHYLADKILCELLTTMGYDDVVEEYRKVGKWYA